MSSLAKTTVLSFTLLAGVAFAAHAQSGSVAALPPGTTAAPPAAAAPIGPSTAYPGPNPGAGYYGGTVQTQAPVVPSPKYVGPSPGAGYYPTETQTQPVQPSPAYPGPRPH
jgi:hypothetical protein